ncbi:transcription initiation factor iie subunit alpha [Quercus suber]|uniref:Transcription initiation factor iie subunit alpha n=1 Tax=Quercus suber TaxID=58331 RepID=A0AAW0KLJ2_QUESU
MSVEPFNKLVKLAARAFYDDITTKGDNQPKTGRSDNRGIAVVVLDALTRRQWVREEDLAKDLKLHSKQLRRTLRFFEEEKLVTRDHRREIYSSYAICCLVLPQTAKGAKIYSAAVAATADGHPLKEGEEKIYDVVRYRLHRMKKKLKDELDNKNTVQEYICPNCGKRYTALDALRLISMEDEFFHCESCNGELVAESDKLAAQEGGDGDDNARRRRREKLKDMLQNLEVQLKPLMDQLTRVKDLPVPEFGTLHAWEARASAAVRAANGDSGAIDPSKSSQGLGYGGTSLPFVGDTKIGKELFIKL